MSPDEGVPGVGGRETADGGHEGEEEVFDHEAPGEQADDRADLVADDRADPDADRAPERDAGDRAQQSSVVWPPLSANAMPRPARQT